MDGQEVNKNGKTGGRSVAKMMVLGLVTALLVGTVGVIAYFGFGIYWLGWQGTATRTAVDAIPYPAAKVNNVTIRYSDYLADLDTLQRFFANQVAEGAAAEDVPTEAELRENTMERLIFTAVLEQEAAKRGVTVSAEEVLEEYNKLEAQSGGAAAMEAELEALYGWTPAKFQEKVLQPYLLQMKLTDIISQDDALNAEALGKIHQIKSQLNEGADFEELAVQYSDDPSAATNRGDLGWFGRGIMVEEFEDVVFALQPGEISEPVQTAFGYHLIRVDEVKEEDGTVTEVSAHHILIGSMTVEEYIDSKVQEADVTKYISI